VSSVALLALLEFTAPAVAANLVAHWNFNEGSPPFADSTTNGGTLYLDPDTYGSPSGPGIDGGAAAHLDWNPVPGTSTRLYATNAAIQTDSFGFSIWILPNWINDYDDLIVKETAYNGGIPDWSKVSWQLHFLGHDANNNVPLEFIVRGANPPPSTTPTFYGVVTTPNLLPYQTMYTNWVHLAGGYDAVSGNLFLYVDGVQYPSAGTPGATNSDGSPLSFGTAKNGDNQFVFFSAGTWIDDVRIYDGPLAQSDVDALRSERLNFNIANFTHDSGSGDLTIVYPSAGLQSYTVYAATSLPGAWTAVTNVIATDYSTTNVLPSAQLDAQLGVSPRAKVFVRVSRP
jgi:hypothetical protein